MMPKQKKKVQLVGARNTCPKCHMSKLQHQQGLNIVVVVLGSSSKIGEDKRGGSGRSGVDASVNSEIKRIVKECKFSKEKIFN